MKTGWKMRFRPEILYFFREKPVREKKKREGNVQVVQSKATKFSKEDDEKKEA